jgi:hypothetical protein
MKKVDGRQGPGLGLGKRFHKKTCIRLVSDQISVEYSKGFGNKVP